ncbi:MAG: 2-C-methyl-D-erythritol 4-phosphate cytidylyltransferase [Eubacteriaceae bacterium]|jgi:2-C-methyl-D-erythritol 4-phosphate cytidylyltransferase|nr:2-C-methyl-D-erythritol 4-phosphate cytidylyltransferase [Eubacteriaceae bacterium]MDN5308498.1 2-C-methyl-D-erythritol 4-phosphate cytidylyltransferase [Eubacteriaceae bacterium]
MHKQFIAAVIPAAGQGTRMNAPINKQYLTLNGKPILAHTLEVFEKSELIHEIILVVNENEFKICRHQVLKPNHFSKVKLVKGGQTRQESVYQGLKAVSAQADLIMIHDGARPLLQEAVIFQSILKTMEYGATTVGVPAKNTIKMIDENGMVISTPRRESLVEIQTPQTFKADLIRKAHDKALKDGFVGTDDASLVEALPHPVKIVTGHYTNLKITTPEDLIIAESILKQFKKT